MDASVSVFQSFLSKGTASASSPGNLLTVPANQFAIIVLEITATGGTSGGPGLLSLTGTVNSSYSSTSTQSLWSGSLTYKSSITLVARAGETVSWGVSTVGTVTISANSVSAQVFYFRAHNM